MVLDLDVLDALELLEALEWLARRRSFDRRELRAAPLAMLETFRARSSQPPPTSSEVVALGAPCLDGESYRLLLDFHEAGERLSVSARTVARLVASGRLRAVSVLGARRVHVEDLREFLLLARGQSGAALAIGAGAARSTKGTPP